jgi:hypothetical protein
MPRKKTTSRVLKKSELRLDDLRSISPTLDLGNGLTVEAYAELQDLMSEYNTALAGIGKIQATIAKIERTLGDFSEHILMGVAIKYGKSSDEYAMAGGSRKFKNLGQVRGIQAESQA